MARAHTAPCDIVLTRLLPQAVLQNVNFVLLTDPYPHLLLKHLVALECGARLEFFIGISLASPRLSSLSFGKNECWRSCASSSGATRPARI
jgi:hypothetical protein